MKNYPFTDYSNHPVDIDAIVNESDSEENYSVVFDPRNGYGSDSLGYCQTLAQCVADVKAAYDARKRGGKAGWSYFDDYAGGLASITKATIEDGEVVDSEYVAIIDIPN